MASLERMNPRVDKVVARPDAPLTLWLDVYGYASPNYPQETPDFVGWVTASFDRELARELAAELLRWADSHDDEYESDIVE
jgi:hypothetical protein